MDDSACIAKNHGHNLGGRFYHLCLLRSPFVLKNSLFRLFICLWSVVVYPCFVYSYVSMQKLVRIATESAKIASVSTTRLGLFPLRTTVAPILPRFFSHPIFRAKLKTLFLAICLWPQLFRASLICRSLKTISWILSIISAIVTSTGRPERCSSFVDVSPR